LGGYGSGRWYRYATKRTTSGLRCLDMNWLHRESRLVPGVYLAVQYNLSDGEDINYSVSLSWTPCNYGGQRPWFICPGCRRRVAKLYLYGKFFRCRHCHGLVYTSQREDKIDRIGSRLRDIRISLGGSADLMEPFPWKPKGMHWSTYEGLHRKYLRELEHWNRMWDIRLISLVFRG